MDFSREDWWDDIMNKKGTKIHNRVRKVQTRTLDNLYFRMPKLCTSCCYNSNCPHIEDMNDVIECDNYEGTIGLNDLVLMMKEQNINMDSFCEKYKIKKEFFMEMIKGKMLMSYKYYVAICTRLHVREFDEFYIYEKRFLNEENNTSQEVI